MRVRQPGAERREELGWLGVTLGGLGAAMLFEHFVVHRQVIIPSLTASSSLPPWMWGALFLPEMAVCFLAGWRLRSLGWIAINAIAGAALRQVLFLGLALAGEPGHAEELFGPAESLARGTPLVAVVYFLMLGLASMTAREPGPVPNR